MPACAGGAEKEVKRRGRGHGRGRERAERRTMHPTRRAHRGSLPLEGLNKRQFLGIFSFTYSEGGKYTHSHRSKTVLRVGCC